MKKLNYLQKYSELFLLTWWQNSIRWNILNVVTIKAFSIEYLFDILNDLKITILKVKYSGTFFGWILK